MDYRERHQSPAPEPGPLDLLYLIALTADPGPVELPVEELVSTLSIKSGPVLPSCRSSCARRG
jgi:hypothetical protein